MRMRELNVSPHTLTRAHTHRQTCAPESGARYERDGSGDEWPPQSGATAAASNISSEQQRQRATAAESNSDTEQHQDGYHHHIPDTAAHTNTAQRTRARTMLMVPRVAMALWWAFSSASIRTVPQDTVWRVTLSRKFRMQSRVSSNPPCLTTLVRVSPLIAARPISSPNA